MRKGEVRPDLQRARIGTCQICASSFRAVKDSYRRKQKYCSKSCWSIRSPKREATCLHCSTAFKTYEKSKVYCSQACRDAHYRTRFCGESAHRWEGGKTKANKLLRTSAAFREWAWRARWEKYTGLKAELLNGST